MNRIVKNTLKIILSICTFVCVMYVVGMFSFGIFNMRCKDIKQIDFNAEKWAEGDLAVRGSMRDAIVKKSIFMGKDTGSIEKILGKPDKKDECVYIYETISKTGECYSYDLGYVKLEFDCNTKKITNCYYYED